MNKKKVSASSRKSFLCSNLIQQESGFPVIFYRNCDPVSSPTPPEQARFQFFSTFLDPLRSNCLFPTNYLLITRDFRFKPWSFPVLFLSLSFSFSLFLSLSLSLFLSLSLSLSLYIYIYIYILFLLSLFLFCPFFLLQASPNLFATRFSQGLKRFTFEPQTPLC
ncbi:unnamed protein product [Acanthosepion pharaonis]|uniref:Transmembrane protein n=1 Tax=Acanthosepion pharaonis TaxID=158019 RepID=A0A812EQ90_ACAPH|nr:unnamed protein product [Sepia pharaonis]